MLQDAINGPEWRRSEAERSQRYEAGPTTRGYRSSWAELAGDVNHRDGSEKLERGAANQLTDKICRLVEHIANGRAPHSFARLKKGIRL